VAKRKQLYVYAIAGAPMRIDDLPRLAIVHDPSCWLAVEWIDELPRATRESLAAQDTIVRTLAQRADALLPMRFGTAFQNETELHASLDEIGMDRLRAALDRVRGCEQMIVRAFRAGATSPSASAVAASGPGTAYLTGRAAALKTGPSCLQPLREQLAIIVRDEIAEASQRAPLIESVYHLIARGDAARYTAIVSKWNAPADIMVHVSGPSPAYAFARDALL
jgi:hypothetical protein